MAIIAIARCSKLPDYEESVRRAGGEPWVVDSGIDLPADVIAGPTAFCCAGGGDVHPALFGEAPHPTFDAAESGRDDYEIELIRLRDSSATCRCSRSAAASRCSTSPAAARWCRTSPAS